MGIHMLDWQGDGFVLHKERLGESEQEESTVFDNIPNAKEPANETNNDVRFARPIGSYHNSEKATSDELNAIRNYVISRKYAKSGTDVVVIGEKIFIFDHSNEKGTYENLIDGDGFGIRASVEFTDFTDEVLKKYKKYIITDGRYANPETLNSFIDEVESDRQSNAGSNERIEDGKPEVANGSVDAKNDGERLGSTSGVLGGLESSGENTSGDSGRLDETRQAAEETSDKLNTKSHLVDNLDDIPNERARKAIENKETLTSFLQYSHTESIVMPNKL